MNSQGIEFRNITKRYGDDARAPLVVKGISFTVPKGTLTTILGPSGCGKTTTLRMIAGLEAPSAGQIFIDGREVTTIGPAERNVSMVFQSYALFPHMNVLANVAYGLSVSGSSKAQARERATATRCCWPPESSLGNRSSKPVNPTLAIAACARCFASALGVPDTLRPYDTFASTSMCGNSA